MTMNQSNKPILILIRGLPGSGKSYLASALCNHIGPNEVVLLDPDATDYSSTDYIAFSKQASADGVDAKLHPYRYLRAQAHQGIVAGKIIVWNQAFTNLDIFHKMVDGLQAYAVEHGSQLTVKVIEVNIDQEVANSRVVDREVQGGHGVSADAFARFIADYASFAGQGFDIVQVDGNNNVSESVTTIMQSLGEFTGA